MRTFLTGPLNLGAGTVTMQELRDLFEKASRCNEPVPAWKFAQPTRCNLERGHAGECDHR